MAKLRIGIINTGKSDSELIESLIQKADLTFIGYFSTEKNSSREVSPQSFQTYRDIDTFLSLVDLVYISAPSDICYKYATKVIRKSKHLILDTFFSKDIVEAQILMDLALEANISVQILDPYQIESIAKSLNKIIQIPHYTQIVSSTYIYNNLTVEQVLHRALNQELNFLLNYTYGLPKSIHCVGIATLQQDIDLLQIHIEFDDFSIADIGISISPENQRQIKIMHEGQRIHFDFVEKSFQLLTLKGDYSNPSVLNSLVEIEQDMQYANEKEHNLKSQIEAFKSNITKGYSDRSSLEKEIKSMKIFQKILDKLEKWKPIHTIS